MFKRKGFLASDWCDPLLASSDDTLRWLAEEPGARAVVNDYFSCHVGTVTPLYFATFHHRCSLERIQFLIERVGARPFLNDLLCAATKERLDVMNYLHALGIRYASFDDYNKHLRMIPNEEGRVAFTLCYPQFWDYFPRVEQDMSIHYRAAFLARHRKDMTLGARVAMTTLKSKIGKDALQKIIGYTKAPWYVAKTEWGEPTWKQNLTMNKSNFFTLLAFTTVLLTILVVFCGLFFKFTDTRPDPFPSCLTMTCNGPFGPPGRSTL